MDEYLTSLCSECEPQCFLNMCSLLSAQDKRFPDGTKVELLFETWSPHSEVDQGEREEEGGGRGRKVEEGKKRKRKSGGRER